MELVETEKPIASNIVTFNRYSAAEDKTEVKFYKNFLRRGTNFACMRRKGQVLFCPSRFAGYIGNTRVKHLAFGGKHGGETTVRIDSLVGKHSSDPELDGRFLARCKELDIEAFNKPNGRAYWLLPILHDSITIAPLLGGDSGYPDEVAEPGSFEEGGAKTVLVNRYERDPKARRACIDHYGPACQVCKLKFDDFYGPIGDGFIHVHHLFPENLRQSGYSVNPIRDLRPVCPNCHAMLHMSDPPFTFEELSELVERQRT